MGRAAPLGSDATVPKRRPPKARPPEPEPGPEPPVEASDPVEDAAPPDDAPAPAPPLDDAPAPPVDEPEPAPEPEPEPEQEPAEEPEPEPDPEPQPEPEPDPEPEPEPDAEPDPEPEPDPDPEPELAAGASDGALAEERPEAASVAGERTSLSGLDPDEELTARSADDDAVDAGTRVRRWPLVLGVVVATLGGALVGLGVGYGLWNGDSGETEVVDARTGEPVALLTDDFEDGDGDLDGRSVPGHDSLTWSVVEGEFTVEDGVVTAEADGRDPAVALLEPGGTVESIYAAFDDIADGSGLVFRYAGPDDHWQLVGYREFTTWVLRRVVDGEITREADTGITTGASVEVVLHGTEIQLWSDGKVRDTVRDATHAEHTAFGLMIDPEADDAEVLEVIAQVPEDSGEDDDS